MTKQTKNSLNSRSKPMVGIDRKTSWIASLATSIALSLGLILVTAIKENRNYKWDHPFSHNLKEMAEWSKKLEWWNPFPILTWRVVISHDGEPYEVKDSVKVFFDVDEHFTLDTRIINGKWYEELQKIMREVALKKDSSAIVWFDFVKKGVEPHLSSQKTKIDAVKWYASPEAIKYEGTSLKIWNIESENIKTAEYRAEVWCDSLKVILTKIVANNPDLDIDFSSISISWDEIQLNEEELKTLEDLARFEWYSSVERMIDANERWEIENKSVSEVINKIINTKRHAVVTFTKKWKPDTIYVVPLILLPILVFKKKKSGLKWWENEVEWWEDWTWLVGLSTEIDWWSTWIEWWENAIWETDWWEDVTWETGWWMRTLWDTGISWWGMNVYPPLPIFGWWKDGTQWWWTKWGRWWSWWWDGFWPWFKTRYRVTEHEKFPVISKTIERTEKPMTQRKQPRDKRPHNFSNERKWWFSRSRTWRTN